MAGGGHDGRPYRRGVGMMLLNVEGRAFVGRRLGESADFWQMPQGGIDEGEAPRAAALRELEEEAGTAKAHVLAEAGRWLSYDLPSDIAGRVWGGKYRGQCHKWFLLRFTGVDADIDLARHYSPEFSDWRWLEPRLLPALVIPFKRALYEALLDEFKPCLEAADR